MIEYLQIPKEISREQVRFNEFSWSPSTYKDVQFRTTNLRSVSSHLDKGSPFVKGHEPGSIWYIQKAPTFFIRTKALQSESFLVYPKGDSIIPISPRAFVDLGMKPWDILLSKDSNVGECCVVDEQYSKNHMFSSGLLKLNIDKAELPMYLFAFLKHPIFKAQLEKIPKGSTIRHGKDLWLDCVIPYPAHKNSKEVLLLVSSLMQAIVEKEKWIRTKNEAIDDIIEKELLRGQLDNPFVFENPDSLKVRSLSRLDTGLYNMDSRRKLFMIENYEHGAETFEKMGFSITRGQNLQVSCIGKSIYSDSPRTGFYRLVYPSDISEYRTVYKYRFLGNRNSLAMIRKGDVIFGAEGFHKGRSIAVVDDLEKTITNIHGIIFHRDGDDATEGIFLCCFLGYLRNIGLIDAIGAGGAGGSLAVGYFSQVPFPKFPKDKKGQIARLYHQRQPVSDTILDVKDLVTWHRRRNASLGICELDSEMKILQRQLFSIQDCIINDGEVVINDYTKSAGLSASYLS
jgi:hypothetical protein